MDRKGAKGFRTVKNKTAAAVQITAEQILRDAFEQREALTKPPEWEITDQEELNEYRAKKRKDFEGFILVQRGNVATYTRYAKWEEQQNEFARARSIYERALEVTIREPAVWTMYAEMEMRQKNVNLARNVWERAISLLPRVSQFWFKYIHMEEMLGNYAGVRQLYSRWMEWKPEEEAWNAYLQFEMRNGEVQLVREIYKNYVQTHPSTKTFLKWAKYEESVNDIERARAVYSAAIEILANDIEKGIEPTQQDIEAQIDEKLFSNFARFEERCKQYERARAIYKFALDNLPKAAAKELYKDFITFEKKFGDRDNIEDVILNKRRFQYEDEVQNSPNNYDIWIDYIKLEENAALAMKEALIHLHHEGPNTRHQEQLEHQMAQQIPPQNVTRIREIYERAIANVPPMREKRFWKRYIYLWINYAVYEELEAKDTSRAREVYRACLQLIPHHIFSFSKIWIMFCHFEIRNNNLDAARKIMGQAIGKAPTEKVFKAYIELEQSLVNFDRCRTIFGKWIEKFPESGKAFIAFAQFEQSLEETERAQAIFELAVESESLDLPELVWKAYIDHQIALKEYQNVRNLYQRLLTRTQHPRVWLSYAQFEIGINRFNEAREVFKSAFQSYKGNPEKTIDRVTIFDAWRDFEQEHGDEQSLEEVLKLTPSRVKKRRPLLTEDGQEAGIEEYVDYIFADEQQALPNMSLLEAAKKWKALQQGNQ